MRTSKGTRAYRVKSTLEIPVEGGTFRMAPPLIVQKPEIDAALDILDSALTATYATFSELR